MSARGESLVEVVVALLLLTVGALALAAGIGHAQRARRQALASGLALAAAEAWLEGWRAGAPRGEAAGGGTISWGAWSAELEWDTHALSACLESARVSVFAAGVEEEVRLSSRRSVAEEGLCGP